MSFGGFGVSHSVFHISEADLTERQKVLLA